MTGSYRKDGSRDFFFDNSREKEHQAVKITNSLQDHVPESESQISAEIV